jgi:prepilin-type N-terminal cleavage/methylation domain-containing protein
MAKFMYARVRNEAEWFKANVRIRDIGVEACFSRQMREPRAHLVEVLSTQAQIPMAPAVLNDSVNFRDSMRTRLNSDLRGFTLIEFMVVVLMLAVLAGIYLPQLARPRVRICRTTCDNNLKQIGLAFRQWALDNGDKFPMQVSTTNWGTLEWVGNGPTYFHFLVMSNELNTPKLLFCPEESDSNRRPAVTFGSAAGLGIGQIPLTKDNSISYFVGVDAQDSQPSMFLAGDHHLTVGGKRPRPGLLDLWTDSPSPGQNPLGPVTTTVATLHWPMGRYRVSMIGSFGRRWRKPAY